MSQKDWGEYYKNTKTKPVSKLLKIALQYIKEKGTGLDMGAGALGDSVYLLDEGFKVTAIDKSPHIETFASELKNEALTVQNVSFEDFEFGKDKYDLVSSIYSLPFVKKENFHTVFTKVRHSLKGGGIFCGQFFGIRDEWAENERMSFHTKEEIEEELKNLQIILIEEFEKDGTKADGTPKHWHVFNVIARKI